MPLDCKRRLVHKPRKQLHFLERLTSFDSISRNFRAGIEDEDVKKSLFIYCQIKVGQRDGGRQGCCLCCGGVEVVFFFLWLAPSSLSCVCKTWGGETKKKKNKTHNTHQRVATLRQSQLSVCGASANERGESAWTLHARRTVGGNRVRGRWWAWPWESAVSE